MNHRTPTEDEIYRIAFQIPTPEARIEYLKQVCQGDAEVERIVALLKEGDPDASFLEKGPSFLGATAAEPNCLTGQTIGPYKLLQEIGEGGFGVVYMAEQITPVRRKVALKIIKPGMDTKQVVARFEAERQALAMMDHPNIAKILDGGETENGRPYFVMELVKGVPLTEFCDRNKLSTRDRLELFVTICNAVQHAHQKGVIHRDLKPSNLMVTLHDNHPVPKVIDFGVSKAISQHLTEKTLFTAYGQMVGTPVYMSPEQAQMSGLDIDTRSDIYSLGVLLYELLTGTTPLEATRLRGTAYTEMQRLILETESPKPSTRLSTLGAQLPMIALQRGTDARQLNQFLRGDLDWIVMKAIDKERNRRYDTASNFAADIRKFLQNEEIEARPPSMSYRMQKFLRRNKGAVIAGSLLLFTLLLGIFGSTIGMIRAKRDAEANRMLTRKANQATDNELKARTEAQNAADKAKLAEQIVRDQNYFHLINLAEVALEKGHPADALRLLNDCQKSLRHWEWRFLYRLACSPRNQPQQFEFDQDIASFDWHPTLPQHAVVMTIDGTLTRMSITEDEIAGRLLTRQVGYQEVRAIQPVADVDFSPDGEMLAASLGANGARIIDFTTGKVVAQVPDRISCLAFHPDPKKRQLASAGHDQVVRLWDLDESEQPIELNREETWWIKDIEYSGDAKWLATCNNSGVASIYSTATGQCKHRLEGHYGPVWALAISHDGRRLATAGVDFKIAIWDMATGTLEQELQGHTAQIYSLDFSADDTRLVSLGHDSRARLWHVASGREILSIQTPVVRTRRNKIAFSQDGNRIAASIGASLGIFDATDGATPTVPIASLDYDGRRIMDVDFMEDGRVVACSGEQGLLLWDLETNQRRPVDFLGPMTTGIDVHPNGRDIAVSLLRSADKTESFFQILIWDSVTGKIKSQSPRSVPEGSGISFHRNGRWLASGGAGGTQVWDCQVPLDQQEGRLINSARRVLFSLCGRYMLCMKNQRREVWIWDASEFEVADAGRLLHESEESVSQAVFSQDGQWIGLGDVVGTATVLSTQPDASGSYGAVSWPATSDSISTVALTSEGRYLATAGTDGVIRIWDLKNIRQERGQKRPELVHVLIEGAAVFNLEFSPDGRRLVSCGHSKVANLWDTRFLYE